MSYRFSFILLFASIYSSYFATICMSADVPYKHPEYANIEGKPVCIDCHDNDENFTFSRYNHTPYFTDHHRLEAKQASKICYMCHKQKSCNNCHAVHSELKPSERDQNNIKKRNHHRGDYLNKHKIDGHISPISCYRCHGNPKNSTTCVRCHGVR